VATASGPLSYQDMPQIALAAALMTRIPPGIAAREEELLPCTHMCMWARLASWSGFMVAHVAN
jgi:hypothetical protein